MNIMELTVSWIRTKHFLKDEIYINLYILPNSSNEGIVDIFVYAKLDETPRFVT